MDWMQHMLLLPKFLLKTDAVQLSYSNEKPDSSDGERLIVRGSGHLTGALPSGESKMDGIVCNFVVVSSRSFNAPKTIHNPELYPRQQGALSFNDNGQYVGWLCLEDHVYDKFVLRIENRRYKSLSIFMSIGGLKGINRWDSNARNMPLFDVNLEFFF